MYLTLLTKSTLQLTHAKLRTKDLSKHLLNTTIFQRNSISNCILQHIFQVRNRTLIFDNDNRSVFYVFYTYKQIILGKKYQKLDHFYFLCQSVFYISIIINEQRYFEVIYTFIKSFILVQESNRCKRNYFIQTKCFLIIILGNHGGK